MEPVILSTNVVNTILATQGTIKFWVQEPWADTKAFFETRPDIIYKADDQYNNNKSKINWHQPSSMPQWASRITIEITKVIG